MKKFRNILLLSLALNAVAVNAEPIVPAIPGADINNVQPSKFEPLAENFPQSEVQYKIQNTNPSESAVKPENSPMVSDEVISLKKQLIDSEQRAKIAEVTAGATQKPSEASYAGALTMYDYKEGGVYDVYCGVGDITNISLQAGEVINDRPASGDTNRWEMGILKSGSAPNEITHVLLKPHYPNVQTTVIIPTNKHVYTIHAIARANWHMVGVSFNYPQEEFAAMTMKAENSKRLERTSEKTAISTDQLDFKYRITGSDVEWKPAQVYNDGNKTFLVMPPSMKHGEAPALFIVDESDNTMLVNYRLKDGIFIVDRLFKKAVLKVGEKQEVQILYENTSDSIFAIHSNYTYPRGNNEFSR
ncbi:MAG: P-type conjugative transfer protein TrbG [Pseudomonadota bacterium]